ncbi:hypothetical protein HMPREF9374_0149 [Desmospora sp. 8437]|nr:hypothetical protein HMPREF9374_0149 [Desmospora sp. 8437]
MFLYNGHYTGELPSWQELFCYYFEGAFISIGKNPLTPGGGWPMLC